MKQVGTVASVQKANQPWPVICYLLKAYFQQLLLQIRSPYDQTKRKLVGYKMAT
jgi:hypothetical protein